PNGALRVVLKNAAIKAGEATATATADARVAASGQVQVLSKGELSRFDPGVWLAEAVGRGPSELNGGWDADLTIPPAPKATPRKGAEPLPELIPGLPPGLNGKVRVRLDPSRVSGLPLQGEATLTAAATALDVLAAFQAGANSVKVDGSASAPNGSGKTAVAGMERWKVDVDAPVLADLAPLKSFLPASGPNQPAWFPKNGKLRIQATANGRWPALTTEGTLALSDYASPALAVGKADARWTFSGIEPNAPLGLQATLTDLVQGQQRIERLQVALDGTPRAHSLTVDATSPVRPPEWVEVTNTRKALVTPELPGPVAASAAASATAPAPTPSTQASKGSSFRLQGNGGWRPERQGGTWSGTLAQVVAAPRGAPQQPWLSARNIQLSVQLDADYAPVQAVMQPNRIEAFGGALAWQQATWQPPVAAGALPRIALDAVLEPLRVAPWLERLQPQFGWSGDLALAGTFKIRSNRTFDADLLIERAGTGDLSLAIEGARRSLGLKQLKIALSTHDGLWELTQAVDGTNIGVISGKQTVRSSPDVMVPDAKAELQGSLGLVVPQLQVWAPWLPPGWRLAGKLQAGAVLSGTVGQPDYRGNVLGSELAIRNLFEGVNLRDGELAVALTGTEATIEKFEFKGGGDGVLRVTGKASFGAAPTADLRVVADKFRALDRIDRRVSLSGAADVGFLQNALSLKGKFTIDNGLIDITQSGAPTLDDDVVVYNLPGGPASTEPPKPTPKTRVKAKPEPGQQTASTGAAPAPKPLTTDIRLAVDLGQELRLRGRGLNTLLRGELVITTPGGELAINGVVRAEEGTYTAYGQNLVVDRGRIFFTGEVGNPRLDILAVRPDIDIRVGVIVSGPATNPRVRLYSEPGLNEFDTLTWLVLGRAPEGLGRDDTALLQRAALAVLAGDKESGGGVINKLGLDELSVSNGTQGAVVSLGKQISKRVYVGYEKALAATGGTWQLIYRVAGRITVRARAGTDNAIDAIWTWRWD
ncbi:MAG: translocation/assembly module TamB domain-containing protein, partial [Rubrivivax sp.]